jgi:hypothetical protein
MPDLFTSQKMLKFFTAFLFAMVMAVFVSCTSGSSTTTPTTPTTTTTTAASLQLSGSPTTIRTDGSTSSTITVTAISATNSTVPGVIVTLSADTGLLNTQTVTTDATGKATVTFTSGVASKANRTANITATSGTPTALLQIQIVGSTLTLSSSGTSLPNNGASPATLTITAKDAGGNPISGATVMLTQTGIGAVTFNPTTGTTDSAGKLVISVAGTTTVGSVTASATGVGATASVGFTVSAATSTFGISLLTLNGGTGVVPASPKTTAMKIGDSLAVQVTAPAPTASVTFATTIGTWNGPTNSAVTVTPVAGIATATLSTTSAGVANIQVLDPLNSALSDTLTVGMTASTAAKILLQASPTVIPKSVGSTVGFSNLTATVYDVNNLPVGGAPVAFSIVSGTGTGSGETISPVIVYSASSTLTGLALGAAPTTFTSGSLSSGGAGVQVRASVVGTAIATQPIGVTNATTSSLDAAIVIGGTAGSVAFGQATKIIDAGGLSTVYSFPMSVLVADSSGSPAPLGTVVNISAWPIAWSTGSGCAIDADTATTGTFYNEDANQNLILDPLEDGTRKYFATGTTASGTGAKDGKITPLNSYGGTVASTNSADLPGTATTDATGLATFNLTYTKSSANWIISRIRAQAVVQGTPAVGQLDFRLGASLADSVPCVLPPSPFSF